jgi:hypothetical protein
MKTKIATLLLLMSCSLASPAQQLKSLVLGKLTYVGEDASGNSGFTVTLDRTNTGRITVQLAIPITFKAINRASVGTAGSNGPKFELLSYTTPTELLFFAPAQPDGFPCPCLAVAVQLFMDTPDPTVTITLSNGETITTSSTVNVFLTALPGQNAIQLQQYAYVVLHAVQ